MADGLAKLRLRNPFPEDRVTFALDIVSFLGIALGAVALGPQLEAARSWLMQVLQDPRCQALTAYPRLGYAYISYVLSAEVKAIEDIREYPEAVDLAFLDWTIRRGAVRLVDPRCTPSNLYARVLTEGLGVDVSDLGASRAALLWSSMRASLTRTVDGLTLSAGHVSAILRRFEAAMRRWRWDNTESRRPVRWDITSERELQDILWLILRSIFDDVVDEDTLPKLGHSFYRADFGIPSLRLLVEAKYARKASDFKSIEKEVMEDSVAYVIDNHGKYDRILVFIYDESASVQEHAVTAGALAKVREIEDVVIVSRPSQLPLRAGQG